MGRIAAPFGVRGWLKVQPFTATPDALLGYASWWLAARMGVEPAAYRLVEGREHSGMVLAKLEGVETREDAMRLRGAEVRVPRQALPEPEDDEVYRLDLVGCTVVNRRGEMLGTVAGFKDSGAHPILEVESGTGATRLIPFVPVYVEGIDLEANRIEVDWEADY